MAIFELSGSYSGPEVPFEEVTSDLLEPRFWPTSGLPTIRPVTAVRGHSLYAKYPSRVGNHSSKMCQALRANVSVQVKYVCGIVVSFERDEPLIVPAIRGLHRFLVVAT